MTQPEQAKNVFKQIVSDGWAAFLRRYPRYAAVDEVVQKMLGRVVRCGRVEEQADEGRGEGSRDATLWAAGRSVGAD